MKIKNGVLSDVENTDIIGGKFIIPNSVTKIEEEAFANCYNLKSIVIPDSVIEIKGWAFTYCKKLESITIPNSVTKIGDYAFTHCHNLESIVISNSIIKIGYYAFAYCTNLTSIIIPNSLTEISTNLTSIIIPNSLTEISNNSFANCYKLESITIPSSVNEIGDHAFYNCNNLISITIPDSITEIKESAFLNCKKLQSKLGNYKAFEKGLVCNNMQYIPNEWNTVEGDIKVCKWGLHYVTNLFDIFNYYYGDLEKDIEIWEVEVGDVIDDNKGDSKKATNAIKPIKKLTRQEIINILNNK